MGRTFESVCLTYMNRPQRRENKVLNRFTVNYYPFDKALSIFSRWLKALSPVQTDATLLTNNSQHCWMLHVASACTPCCMLLDVVACCCTKFETGQTFQTTTPNISFVPWSPKRRATMLDPFAQLFQHCWGYARSLRMVYKDLWVVSFPRCTTGPKIVETCCISLHHCQHARNNSQHCWELLRPFARSLRRKV